MRILIANSKEWFHLEEDISNSHEIRFVNTKEELSLENLKDFNPDLVFFPHWHWIVPSEIHRTYQCILFHIANHLIPCQAFLHYNDYIKCQ